MWMLRVGGSGLYRLYFILLRRIAHLLRQNKKPFLRTLLIHLLHGLAYNIHPAPACSAFLYYHMLTTRVMQDKGDGLGEDFLAVVILHNDMIRLMECDQMLFF